MSEGLNIQKDLNKSEKYRLLFESLDSLCRDEDDFIAKMANISAAIKEVFGFWWVGFYRVMGKESVLGPFQGPIACQRISYGKGVCGTAWREKKTLLVPDVERFPGHIACSSSSKSEIVIPCLDSFGTVQAILDVDSEYLCHFDTEDQAGLEKIAELLYRLDSRTFDSIH